MKAKEALISWTPNVEYIDSSVKGKVDVRTPYYLGGEKERDHSYSSGSAFIDRRKLEGEEAALLVLADFHAMVVRDGINPQTAHKELCKIDEYRQYIAADIPGAE
jgi:hypothetical protein